MIKLEKHQSNYPPGLLNLKKPPEYLYMQGAIRTSDFEGIAVVGSRRMSSYGENVVRSIIPELVYSGFTIISGLAFGVDAYAQSLALKMGGRTVAVLASGIHSISPRSNADLARQIVQSGRGGLISSYPPFSPAFKSSFPERDTLMAALSTAVLVIEASEKSGTVHTVNAALDMGKEVFVVPGSIFSDVSRGCHRYIQDGARLITCAQDIYDALGADLDVSRVSKIFFSSELEKHIYESLDFTDVTISDISLKLKEPASRIMQSITYMEIRGLVRVEGNKVYRL